MPDLHPSEREDVVFPELRWFTPGQRIRLRIRNNSPMLLGPLASQTPSEWGLRGRVMQRPIWAASDTLAVMPDEDYPPLHPRIVRLSDVRAVNGQRWRASMPAAVKNKMYESWTVQGSTGGTYIVSWDSGIWGCTCPGWKYHGKCKHVTEKMTCKAST